MLMRIMGIDPGLATTGYAVIENTKSARGRVRRPAVLTYGAVQTSKNMDYGARLLLIHRTVKKIILKWNPDLAAVEKLFFARNAKTAMKVGEARGVILVTCALAKLPVYELTPIEIKSATTGYGAADKTQVGRMIAKILGLKSAPTPDDAADALACAFAGLPYLHRTTGHGHTREI